MGWLIQVQTSPTTAIGQDSPIRLLARADDEEDGDMLYMCCPVSYISSYIMIVMKMLSMERIKHAWQLRKC